MYRLRLKPIVYNTLWKILIMDFRFRLITAEDRPFMVQMLYEATIASEQTFDIDNIEIFPIHMHI
ncbi:hypothetical protein DP183_06800 [Enterobacter kobei]|nr:hypothetical protein DP183_06800 [Enterobacter kobei]